MDESHKNMCISILEVLMKNPKAQNFLTPALNQLGPEHKEIYRSLIKAPKDLGTILADLRIGKFSSISSFSKDVEMCFENAKKFCKDRYPPIYRAALEIQKAFKAMIEKEVSALTMTSKPISKLETPVVVQPPPAPPMVKPPKPHATNRTSSNFESSCLRILNSVSQTKLAEIFLQPVDLVGFPDYTLRVAQPMDFSTIRSNLERSTYSSPSDFARNMRRVFGNCLRYNYMPDQRSLRQDVKKMLTKFEQEWEANFSGVSKKTPFMRECLLAVEDVLKLPTKGAQKGVLLCQNFMNPVQFYFEGQLPDRYADIVKHPMDFGTVISRIVEADYVQEDLADLRANVDLISSNCERYWTAVSQGPLPPYHAVLLEEAKILRDTFSRSLDKLIGKAQASSTSGPAPSASYEGILRTMSSLEGEPNTELTVAPTKVLPREVSQGKAKAAVPNAPVPGAGAVAKSTSSTSLASEQLVKAQPLTIQKKPADRPKKKVDVRRGYQLVLSELNEHYIIGPWENRVCTAEPFMKAVDPARFGDYYEIVKSPINLRMIEKKVKGDGYSTAKSFLADMELLRDNAHLYNTGDAGKEVRYLADTLLEYFKTLLRKFLKEVAGSGDEALIRRVLGAEMADFLAEPDAPGMTAFFDGRASERTEKETAAAAASGASAVTGIKAVQPQAKPIVPVVPKPAGKGGKASDTSVIVRLPKSAPPAPVVAEVPTNVATTSDSNVASNVVKQPEPVSTYEAPPILTISRSKSKDVLRIKSKGKTAPRPSDAGGAEPLVKPGLVRSSSVGAGEFSELEEACLRVLRKVKEHEWVKIKPPSEDPTRTVVVSAVADFFSPVVVLHPDLAEEYLRVVNCPMDLTTVEHVITSGGLIDAEDFYDKIMLVFKNAVLFNPDYEYLTKRCEIIIEYIHWLSLEFLPLKDDTGVSNPENLGALRVSLRDSERSKRLEVVNAARLDKRACGRLLKVFEQRKCRKEFEFFNRPVNLRDVPNYTMYVRRPMDFQTLRKTLEDGGYGTNEEFLKDLRRIFTNAIDFNKNFKDSDPYSKLVYAAAETFLQKLDAQLYRDFSIEVAERRLRELVVRADQAFNEDMVAEEVDEGPFADRKPSDRTKEPGDTAEMETAAPSKSGVDKQRETGDADSLEHLEPGDDSSEAVGEKDDDKAAEWRRAVETTAWSRWTAAADALTPASVAIFCSVLNAKDSVPATASEVAVDAADAKNAPSGVLERSAISSDTYGELSRARDEPVRFSFAAAGRRRKAGGAKRLFSHFDSASADDTPLDLASSLMTDVSVPTVDMHTLSERPCKRKLVDLEGVHSESESTPESLKSGGGKHDRNYYRAPSLSIELDRDAEGSEEPVSLPAASVSEHRLCSCGSAIDASSEPCACASALVFKYFFSGGSVLIRLLLPISGPLDGADGQMAGKAEWLCLRAENGLKVCRSQSTDSSPSLEPALHLSVVDPSDKLGARGLHQLLTDGALCLGSLRSTAWASDYYFLRRPAEASDVPWAASEFAIMSATEVGEAESPSALAGRCRGLSPVNPAAKLSGLSWRSPREGLDVSVPVFQTQAYVKESTARLPKRAKEQFQELWLLSLVDLSLRSSEPRSVINPIAC